MKKTITIILVIVAIPFLWWTLSPYFFENEVDESLDDILAGAEIVNMVEETPPEEPKAMTDRMRQEEQEVEEVESEPGDTTSPTTPEPLPPTPVETSTPTEPPPPPPAEEEAKAVIVSQGTFEGLAFHNAEGKASLIKFGEQYFIRFESDFKITNGPDLFVDLGYNGDHDGSARLGKLKGSSGGQNYTVPVNIDLDNYNEVWVWCRAFSVPFGKAVFN